jgi:hypothetical protein
MSQLKREVQQLEPVASKDGKQPLAGGTEKSMRGERGWKKVRRTIVTSKERTTSGEKQAGTLIEHPLDYTRMKIPQHYFNNSSLLVDTNSPACPPTLEELGRA